MNKEIPGGLSISNEVIADLAGYAAMECYGVVGMATPNLSSGLDTTRRDGSRVQLFADFVGSVAQTLLPAGKLRQGIMVDSRETGVRVDLYIIVEYGVNIAAVCDNLVERVTFVLTDLAGVKVDAVEVHVDGVKVRR